MEKLLNVFTLPKKRLPKIGRLPAKILKEVRFRVNGVDIELGHVPSLPKVTFHLDVLEVSEEK